MHPPGTDRQYRPDRHCRCPRPMEAPCCRCQTSAARHGCLNRRYRSLQRILQALRLLPVAGDLPAVRPDAVGGAGLSARQEPPLYQLRCSTAGILPRTQRGVRRYPAVQSGILFSPGIRPEHLSLSYKADNSASRSMGESLEHCPGWRKAHLLAGCQLSTAERSHSRMPVCFQDCSALRE